MNEQVLNIESLPEVLYRLLQTSTVRIKENNGMIQIIPVKDTSDCTIGLRGMLSGCDDMSVDKFLARCNADRALDL